MVQRVPARVPARVSPGASRTALLEQAAEAAVVALAMGGDRQAFTELVWRRQSWLRNLLRRLCRDGALADDLAQQVLLQAWRALPQLHSVAAFGGWLRRLAINAWLAHRRGARMATVPLETEEELGVAATPGPSGAALDLDGALGQLRHEERLCVVLAYSEGMSHGEISAATRLPLGTVKSHVSRGAERLRGLLHAYDNSHGGKVHVG
jgi:RNA polymerase sigma factor (sigma-70 family)